MENIFIERFKMEVKKSELTVKPDLVLEKAVAQELNKKDDDERFFIELDREDSSEGGRLFQISRVG